MAWGTPVSGDGSRPFVGLLTDMSRGGYPHRAAFAFPAFASDSLSRKKDGAPCLQHRGKRCPAVSRLLTWFPCSANKNACPALGGGGVAHLPQKPEPYGVVGRPEDTYFHDTRPVGNVKSPGGIFFRKPPFLTEPCPLLYTGSE